MRGGVGAAASSARGAGYVGRRGRPATGARGGSFCRSAAGARPGEGGVIGQRTGGAMGTETDVPRERYNRLLQAAQRVPAVTTAVAHPCDAISIEGVAEAARLGLIAPILVGPPARIRDAARQADADISSF